MINTQKQYWLTICKEVLHHLERKRRILSRKQVVSSELLINFQYMPHVIT